MFTVYRKKIAAKVKFNHVNRREFFQPGKSAINTLDRHGIAGVFQTDNEGTGFVIVAWPTTADQEAYLLKRGYQKS